MGGALLGFELLALPLSGATPAVSRWGRDEILGNAAGALAFGLAVAAGQRYLPHTEGGE